MKRYLLFQAVIALRGPCLLLVFIVVIPVTDTFYQVPVQERQVALLPELAYMGQLVAKPAFIVDELGCRGIVQQDGVPEHHGHFIFLQPPGGQPGQQRIFPDITFHGRKLFHFG